MPSSKLLALMTLFYKEWINKFTAGLFAAFAMVLTLDKLLHLSQYVLKFLVQNVLFYFDLSMKQAIMTQNAHNQMVVSGFLIEI